MGTKRETFVRRGVRALPEAQEKLAMPIGWLHRLASDLSALTFDQPLDFTDDIRASYLAQLRATRKEAKRLQRELALIETLLKGTIEELAKRRIRR